MTTSAAIKSLIAKGLIDIEQRYGSNGTEPKAYHNAEHAQDVMSAVRALAKRAAKTGKIPAEIVPLLELAACYHDYEHSLPTGNEEASAQVLAERMVKVGVFSVADIELCRQSIMATTVQIKRKKFTQQGGDEYYCKLIADADLCNVGKRFTIYKDRADKLAVENLGRPITPGDQKEIHAQQVWFLRVHQYLTEEGKTLFPHQADNLDRLQRQA